MKSKAPPPKKPGEIGMWMVSYTDMVTLLFCFFVILFAMAEIDPVRMRAISEAFAQRQDVVQLVGSDSLLDMMGNGIVEMPDTAGQVRAEVDRLVQIDEQFYEISQQFRSYFGDLANEVIEIVVEPDDRMIGIMFADADDMGGVLFDSGRADLRPEALEILAFVGDFLDMYPDSRVVIEGHTDNVPINTAQFPDPHGTGVGNDALSAARALSVKNHFVNVFGFERSFVDAIPRGEHQPIADNNTAEGRAQNRRVEIRIYFDFFAQ